MFTHTHTQTVHNVYSNFISGGQTWKNQDVLQWMDNQTMGNPYNGILFSNKKK